MKELKHPGGAIIKFSDAHAERIMALPDSERGGWEWVPTPGNANSDVEKIKTKDNAVDSQPDKGHNKGSNIGRKKGNSKSKKPRK
jgi:hypothetical protein